LSKVRCGNHEVDEHVTANVHHDWKKAFKRQALTLGAAVFALGLGLTSQAHAQSSCARIQSELASLHNGGGGTGQLQQSINQQMREMARAQGAFDRFQCSFGASPQCGSIVASLNQMQANLSQMQRQLARTGGGGRGDPRRIAELERAFATQCGPGQREFQQQVRQSVQPGNLLEAIFGIRSQPTYVARRPADSSGIAMPGQPYNRGFDRPGEFTGEPDFRLRGGTFRTMCVRTSDGFYWPISFSTTRDRFDEDRSLCAAMCPGTSVELFAYRNPGQQVDAMMNTLTGEPYTTQTYAFAYRDNFDPDNRCTPSAVVLEELRASTGIAAGPTGPQVPQPTARPDMASDPETRALDDAGMSFSGLGRLTRPEVDGEQIVRRVGPNYGYFNN
jgi:hypothetical protein